MTLAELKPDQAVRCPAVKPVGGLAEILSKFEAPPVNAKKIARRAGAVVGPNGIPHEFVERVILKTMETNHGLPNWQQVFDALGEAANRIYRGKSIKL